MDGFFQVKLDPLNKEMQSGLEGLKLLIARKARSS